VERPEVEIMKREPPPGLRLVCARPGDRFRLERKGSSTLDRDEMPKGEIGCERRSTHEVRRP
jgi:hypothetical protein